MSLRPTTALPPLAGLGIHAHAPRPGYLIDVTATLPAPLRAWLADEDVTVIEDRASRLYRITVADLPDPVLIPADEMKRAALGVSNLIAARLHDARKAKIAERVRARRKLAALVALDDEWTAAFARAFGAVAA